jgi:sensor histidine kinase regulating citrate/malate metabolism
LLDNSFKASATEVLIRLKIISGQLIIDYLDNGIGINPNFKDSIFDFGVTTTSGSGIGLHHIKKIVESMKGKVRMNEVKHGANFIINIPQNS